MATLHDLHGAFDLLEEQAAANDTGAYEPGEAIRVRGRPLGRRSRRWLAPAIGGGVILLAAVVVTAIVTTGSPAHRATKHAPPPAPDVTVTLSVDGRVLPRNELSTTVALGRRMSFGVRFHAPAGVTIRNVYLFLGGPRFGLGGGQPEGDVRVLKHVPGAVPSGQPLTATWTVSRLFNSSEVTLAAQLEIGFTSHGVASGDQEQRSLLVMHVAGKVVAAASTGYSSVAPASRVVAASSRWAPRRRAAANCDRRPST